MTGSTSQTGFPLETIIGEHLRYNFVPSINSSFVPFTVKLIRDINAHEVGFNDVLEMPNGKEMKVGDIIEGLHLEQMLNEEFWEEI